MLTLELVELDRDHPGFRDPVYRQRRNQIAALAQAHVPGQPVVEVDYTSQEHGVWRHALEKLSPLHQRYACQPFLDHWSRLGFPTDRIPSFAQVNAALGKTSGFGLEPVAGLVSPRQFMTELARGVFAATQYVRHHSQPLYTPEPDVLHELIGHAALLCEPAFARLNRLFGEATQAASESQIEELIRLYWYGLEFGVVDSPEGHKVVGAGLLSSFGELGRFEAGAQLQPFDIARVANTPFDPTNYQTTLFVAPDLATLLGLLSARLHDIIAGRR